MEHYAGWRHICTLTADIQTENENWAFQALLCIWQCQYIGVIVSDAWKLLMLRDLEAFLRYVTLIAVRFYLVTYLLTYLLCLSSKDKKAL